MNNLWSGFQIGVWFESMQRINPMKQKSIHTVCARVLEEKSLSSKFEKKKTKLLRFLVSASIGFGMCARVRAPHIWISHALRFFFSILIRSLRIWLKIFNKFISIFFSSLDQHLVRWVSICLVINRFWCWLFWPCLYDLLMTALA